MCVCVLDPSSSSHQSAAESRRSELRAGIRALLKDSDLSLPAKRLSVHPVHGGRKRGVLIRRRVPVSY